MNSEYNISLSANSGFSISPTSGSGRTPCVITVEDPSLLDYETRTNLTFQVQSFYFFGILYTVGQEHFADMIFLRIGTYNLIIYYAFLVNKSLKTYSWTCYFRGFVKIREIGENIMSAKISCPTVAKNSFEIRLYKLSR